MDINYKPTIIFDTDMDTDCDDAGAIAMLLEAHLAGKIELIGVVADVPSAYAAPCCEVMLNRYGIDVPIGTVYEDVYERYGARFESYRVHQARMISKGKVYNRTLAEGLGKTDKDYPSAAKVYRDLLCQARDRSVTVLCVGLMTAVADALLSEGDEDCPLSGVELFRRKVKCVVTMGNIESEVDFNWGMDAYGASKFFELCPVPVFISGEGEDIITGDMLSSRLDNGHPVRRAYEIWQGRENCGRSSWDLVSALAAIEPQTPYLRYKKIGECTYNEEENHIRIAEGESSQYVLVSTAFDNEKTADLLNAYILGE